MMAFTLIGVVKYISTLTLVILVGYVEYGYTGNNCKLEMNQLNRRYFLSCDGPVGKERSPQSTVHKKEKQKRRRGPPGEPGPQGPPGRDGKDGKVGPIGPIGPIGATGVPGPRGHKGHRGPKGDMGGAGPMGQQGEPGIPGNCIKTPPKYSQKTKEHYHCLAGPKGPQGLKGDSGPHGNEGAAGAKGDPGQTGPKGPRGRRGPVGMPGLPGTAGKIECKDHFTDWISQYNVIEAKSIDGFFCPKGQFLQGFKRERSRLQERYYYICCSLI